ncbi:MAG: ABC transporter ATP-binding protein [Polyangiales bacterium]
MSDEKVPDDLRAMIRETPAVLGNAWRTLRIVWRVDAAMVLLAVAARTLEAASTVGIAWVGRRLVDGVVDAARAHRGLAAVAVWVGLEFALVATRAAVKQGAELNQQALRSRLGLEVNLQILQKAANVSYSRFEDPEFVNQMAQARREASGRPLGMVMEFLAIAQEFMTLAGFAALLWGIGPWALGAVALAALPPFAAELWFGRALHQLSRRRTQRNRQAFYLESVLTSEANAKEVKLFALAGWLIDRFRGVHEEFHREELALARRRALATTLLGIASSAAYYGAAALVVGRAALGGLSLGSMTLALAVLQQGQRSLASALSAFARVYEHNLYMANLFAFLATEEDEPDEPIPASFTPDARPPEVRFEDVSYRYPGAARDALQGVTLTLRPGETVALVGRNGAGKTTLVKLLVGIYRPTHGRILLDGVDTATMSPPALRRRVAVLFQDFARFQFSAGDNVGLGWLPRREDPEALARAVREAGADDVVTRLPQGLQTPLGRAFGGDDLSGGQWQRLALARAFMRPASLVVLDEPTAALDAEAEHEVFARMAALKRDRTALLITHRFANVRDSDRVVVLDGGAVCEEGTHAELLGRGGLYARMFRLQASGYQEPTAP